MRRRIAVAVGILVALSTVTVASAATLGVTPGKLTTFQVAGMTGSSMTGLVMYDRDLDGRVDEVVVDFSGPVAANMPDWTLTDVPSGGTLAAVAAVGSQVFLTLNQNLANPADTAVGGFTVALDDTTGLLVSFGPTAPADKAGPVPTAVATTAAGATAGRMDSGDQLEVVFSEALDSASVPASTTVLQQDDGLTGLDSLGVTGVTSGLASLGGSEYLIARGKQVSFTPSSVSLTAGRTVRVTIGGSCTGDCNQLRSGQGRFVYAPAPTITDLSGNAAAGSFPTAAAFRLF